MPGIRVEKLRKTTRVLTWYSNYVPYESDEKLHSIAHSSVCRGTQNTFPSISAHLVTGDRVVAGTEVVSCSSVIRWVCHGRAARLVHHPAFLRSAFTLPATEHLPTVSAHCHQEEIRSRFGHSPHLSPSLKLSSWTLKMFTCTLVASFM